MPAATFGASTANALINEVAASGVFASLHSGAPGTTGASELSGNGYARQAVSMSASTARSSANSGAVVFGPASGDWVAATHFGLWSAVSGGTFIAGGALTTPRTVIALDSASFGVGALAITG